MLRPATGPAALPAAEVASPSSQPDPLALTDHGGCATRSSSHQTPEPGGRILTLAPKAKEAGWFSSSEAQGNHLGDSFLYAGYFGGQALISALRIELGSVPAARRSGQPPYSSPA